MSFKKSVSTESEWVVRRVESEVVRSPKKLRMSQVSSRANLAGSALRLIKFWMTYEGKKSLSHAKILPELALLAVTASVWVLQVRMLKNYTLQYDE